MRVGLGQDGIRDYWSPYGDGDMLARAWQLAYRSSLRRDDLIEGCVDRRLARRALDRRVDAVVPRPDHRRRRARARRRRRRRPLVVAADTVTAAVMDHPPRTVVLHDGRIVARDGELV